MEEPRSCLGHDGGCLSRGMVAPENLPMAKRRASLNRRPRRSFRVGEMASVSKTHARWRSPGCHGACSLAGGEAWKRRDPAPATTGACLSRGMVSPRTCPRPSAVPASHLAFLKVEAWRDQNAAQQRVAVDEAGARASAGAVLATEPGVGQTHEE
jgi:hypothetical protein